MSDEPIQEETVAQNDTSPPDPVGSAVPASPYVIRISDILNTIQADRVREIQDKAKFDGIASLPYTVVRATLAQWATLGFPNAYTMHEIPISVPPLCSDGVSRTLDEYITFCSGKSIQEHVALLQERMPDIAVGFTYTGNSIRLVVTRI
jgi:hypothetical protein